MGVLYFGSLLGYAALIMMIIPMVKTGAALITAFCGMLFISYLGVIVIGAMIPTAYALMLTGLSLLAYALISAFLGKHGLRERVKDVALWFYVAGAAAVVICAKGLLIYKHDDISFWARAAKELYSFDCFYIHGAVNMYHLDYNPMLASLQYCITRVFGWNDEFITYVPAACMLVSIASLTELMPRKRTALPFCVLGIYAFLAFGFFVLDLRSDGSMALLFTAALLCLFIRKDNSLPTLLPCAAVISIIAGMKNYSGLLFGLTLIIALIYEIIKAPKCNKRIMRTVCVISLAALVFMQVSWSVVYNFTSAMAHQQGDMLRRAYETGSSVSYDQTQVSLGTLLKGNPRTEALLSGFRFEEMQWFPGLCKESVIMLAQSKLKGAPLFLLLCVPLLLITEKEKRSRLIKVFVWLSIASLCYLLGLFASFIVQSETAPASVNYMKTVATPFLIAGVFCALYCFDAVYAKRRWICAATLALMCGLLVFFLPPEQIVLSHGNDSYELYSKLANDYYNVAFERYLTDADAGKSAVLIDSTEESSGIGSKSGKTHSYQYYALPVRVAEPTYLPYGEPDSTGESTKKYLEDRMKYFRCELLMLRIEDENHWRNVCEALGLSEDNDDPMGVYDVEYKDGEFTYSLRR